MRSIVVLALVLCLAVMPVAVCHSEEKDDAWEDWYAMLEVQAGTTWEFKTECARLYAAGKVGGYKGFVGVLGTEIDIDDKTEAEGPVAILGGVTYNLGNLRDWGVDVSWAKHFGVNVGLGVTYDWVWEYWGWRAMVSIIDISQSGGNAEKQRQR